jgi:putative transposase
MLEKIEPVTVDSGTEKPLLRDAHRAALREMVKSAADRGEVVTGPGGLLADLTKAVVEIALDEEMIDHLGYERHASEGRNGQNSRNGFRSKRVIADGVGEVVIDVPRDRDSSFSPTIVAKRQRRLSGIDEVILSLYARGMTTGDISAHFAQVYGVSVSKDTVSRITDRVEAEMVEWSTRPLASHYLAVFVDAIHVRVRDGQVANRPFYAAMAVDLDGRRDVLGVWAGTPGDGESSKFWLSILTELRNRGVRDIFYLVCDGLKGMPSSVGAVFPETIVQTCVVHLIRNSFRYASKKYWPELAKDLKKIYGAAGVTEAAAALEELDEKLGGRYPAIIRSWRNAWDVFVPFLDIDREIRGVLATTNAIESLNSRFRRSVNSKGHFPTEQAALKTLYLTVRSLDPKGTGQKRWMMRWKPVLNTLAIVFAERMPASL